MDAIDRRIWCRAPKALIYRHGVPGTHEGLAEAQRRMEQTHQMMGGTLALINNHNEEPGKQELCSASKIWDITTNKH
jgi:hypothetical protein